MVMDAFGFCLNDPLLARVQEAEYRGDLGGGEVVLGRGGGHWKDLGDGMGSRTHGGVCSNSICPKPNLQLLPRFECPYCMYS